LSATPIRCPRCHDTTVATQRPSVNAHTRRLRTQPGLAYGVPVDQPGHVAVICPGCGATVVIRGRLIIEQDAA
jgi:predicted RNA-binding Zn-ribbon protein involved in translation (DUF1610 family)